ncbi:MAG TPA: ABC transporter substrate-binding protein, partial [Halanaerobiales bacterium]|nr:ABC transporter substrate-binding protein [Halanaerobiales bacterium]
ATAPNANDYEYNPEKAKELMAEAGYPDGFETAIYVASNHTDRVQEAQLIQQHLAQVGIDCEVVAIEWGTYLDVTATGEAPMFRERWVTGGPSPYDFVELYHKDSSWNSIFGTYDKPVVNELVEELVTTVDNEARWAIYQEIQEIVLEDAACYPLYWPIQGAVYNDELHIPAESFTAFNEYIDVENWSFK